MSSTTARVGVAVAGSAITGTSDMPDLSGDHFTWEGRCWEAVTDPDLLVATMDPSASPAAKEALTARLVQSMSVATKKLVVTEEAVLNHATLIGQTVVDDINVQGKLIGTDGVFTGTVDFANVNVTGELLANEISGEYLYGTVIEGGEIRTGSDESRGSFLLGDRAYVSPVDGYSSPGIRLGAPDSNSINPPGLGIDGGSVSISGGRESDGRYTRLYVASRGFSAIVSPPDGDTLEWGSRISAGDRAVQLTAGQPHMLDGAEVFVTGPVIHNGQEISHAEVRLQVDHNGKRSRLRAGNGATTVESSDGTTTRALKVDGSGVWVTTNKSGSVESWNLEETAKDTGWQNFSISSGLTLNDQTAWRNKGGIIWLSGRVRDNWAVGAWTTIATLPPETRPSRNIRATAPLDGRPAHLLEINTAGQLRFYRPPNESAVEWSVSISTLMWPVG